MEGVSSVSDEEFDEYDKPGAERSRRRRGGGGDDDDDLDSDLEGDLLEEDWLSSKKNPSELSDEELNDDLLQSDEEDQNTSAQGAAVSLNATSGLSESFELQEGDEYTAEEYRVQEEQEGEEYRADEEEGMDCTTAGNEDEVLELQIDEPLDDEFQVEDYGPEPQEVQPDGQEMTEAEGAEPEEEVEDVSQVTEAEELEAEREPEADAKEESDEDDEDDGRGRLRFKTERKDSTVVRLSDAVSKRRNIPETLELTEEAKADLLEFEEKERLRKQGRFGGRGRGGVGGGRGGGGGPPAFGLGGFRKDGGAGRGRMNESRPPLMPVMGMQPRMMSPQSHRPQPRPSGPRGGPGLFPTPLMPIPQQHLQSLMSSRPPAPHQSPQHELHPPRPHGHAHALPHTHSNQQQQQQQQPKNIHINPHFRGPASSSPVQVPLISSAPNQPRPNLGPQRFPGPADFQQHLQGNFLQPQRPPPQEQWRRPPPPPHQEREPFYSNEPRFPAQPLFDLPGSAPLMNNNILPLSFPQPGPGFCPPVGGMFQRDLPPPRPNLPPPQPSPAPPAPRSFMGPRQPFPPQQHNAPFSPQHAPFGMQGLIQPHPQQQQHHDPPPHPHHHPMHQQQQQHRQEGPPLPHNHHRQHQHQEQHPIMHFSHPPFRQPIPSGPRQMKPRPQNNMGGLRMGSPSSMQHLQSFPQRNSNLRELPVAPGNPNPIRHHQPRPLTRPGQGGGGEDNGRGRGLPKTVPPPATLEMKNKIPAAQTSTPVQKNMPNRPAQDDDDEDEETRQYRLKIEEQKRLREEILKRKEMRRQMQAGARKKELLERLGGQAVPQTPPVQTQSTPTQPQSTPTQPQPIPTQPQTITTLPQTIPTLPKNIPTQPQTSTTPPSATPNGIKSRLQNPSVEQKQRPQNPQRHVPQLPSSNIDVTAPPAEKKIAPIQAQANIVRKRTVMQRVNTGGLASPQIPQKVRVVKRLAGGEETPPLQNQPLQMIGRATPQQRPGTTRKVTVPAAGPQQQQQNQPPPPQQPPEVNQSNRVVVSGRGRGRGVRGGRMMPPNRQSTRSVESQSSTVSIDGLSSSTTEKQIKNLLNSIGPIQMFKMMPQQRKAIAKFVNPQHALSFQHSFHRHMIDLSHIDVTILDS
ncbi:RNA-binding protein 33 isoform X1 [Tachysurus fulvidraco]|uniref:RNA-binding protein 33 isoform X1 n=1 Tax=Tachysurus fulvidraco TaxID=1234273 RepID=UPI001FEE4B6B|nr:RNA-binding protein 33 isoform X1 [Tachysurus fulvidraco]